MTNIKRVLSLALAAVMLMGMMVIGAGAANVEYTDAESIENAEAVELLTALDVLGGYPDGSFKPEGTLTRAEAAAVICRIMLGADVAESLSAGTAPFADVKATNWAAGYIAYLKNLGVVSGIGNNKFNPQGTVTVGEFAKMLLGAAGIDGQFTGSQWLINVSVAAQNADILSSKDVVTADATRDAVAGYTMNALFYTEDGQVDGYYFNVEGYKDIVFASRSEAMIFAAVTSNDSLTADKLVEHKDTTGSLAAEVFSVTKDSNAEDAFGRPAVEYIQNKGKTSEKSLLVSPKEAVATYTTGVSANDLYKLLGSKATIKAAGSSVTTTSVDADKVYINNAKSGTDVNVAANTQVLGGNGIVTEIYKTSTANEYIVVQIQPTLAKVTAVSNTAATKTEGAYTTYTIAGNGYKVYTTVVDADNDKNEITIDGTIAKNDYVLIYGNADMAYVTSATLVEGKLTGYSSKTGYTIGGTAYNKSNVAVNGAAADTTLNAYNQTATYALDTYGNVIGSVTVTTPTNYVFVLSATVAQYLNTSTNKVENVVEATVITSEGALSTIRVDAENATDLDKTTENNQVTGLFTYTVNNDNEYVLTIAGADVSKAVTTVEKNEVELATGLYANSATKFFVATKDEKGEKYTGVTVYSGIANVPNLDVAANTKALDSNKDGVAEVVFMDATTEAGATANYVYVTDNYTSDGTTFTYEVIVDGESTTMKLTGVSGAGLYTVTNGAASAVTNVSDTALNISAGTDGIYGKTTKYFTYNNGLLMSSADNDSYAVLAAIGANVPVYTFKDGACTTGTASDLSGTTGTMIVFAVNAAKDAVSAVYVVA